MPTVVGVQFKPVTKIYHFDPNGMLDLAIKDYVIVGTQKGQEIAQVVEPPHRIGDEEVVGTIKPIVRRATAWDLVQQDQWAHKEREALTICRSKAGEHRLDIKIVRCTYSFTGGAFARLLLIR